MNQLKRDILWEPYFIDDFELGSDTEEDNEEISLREEDGDDFEVSNTLRKIKNLPKIMITPFGPYRIDDKSNPLRRFEFWVGHTNFRIGQESHKILNTTPGVEALIVTTPYRFILAVGKMFKFADVRVIIERELCGKHMIDAYLNQIHDEKTLNEVKTCLESIRGNKYWTMYILPNGFIHSFYTDNRKEFINKYNLFSEAKQLSNGILMTSEDDYEHSSNKQV